jgi:hypothetical protein
MLTIRGLLLTSAAFIFAKHFVVDAATSVASPYSGGNATYLCSYVQSSFFWRDDWIMRVHFIMVLLSHEFIAYRMQKHAETTGTWTQ